MPRGSGESRIEYPAVSPEAADSTIGRLRPFIMSAEDIHLPKVIRAAKRLVGDDPPARELLDYVGGHFASVVDDRGHFKSTYVESGSGRLGEPIRFFSDGDLATHYVYGRLIHADEWRLRELEEHGLEAEAFQALLRHVHELMRVAYWLRERLNTLIEVGKLPASTSARSTG